MRSTAKAVEAVDGACLKVGSEWSRGAVQMRVAVLGRVFAAFGVVMAVCCVALTATCFAKMAQQTSVWGKMISGTAGAAVGVKRAGHNAKQDGKIEGARKHVRALTYEVGRLTVRAMDSGADLAGPVSERYEKIKAAREEIRSLEAAKRRTKAMCPHCGEKVVAGMRYCGACGEGLAQ